MVAKGPDVELSRLCVVGWPTSSGSVKAARVIPATYAQELQCSVQGTLGGEIVGGGPRATGPLESELPG
eukprot:5607687-Alexandrium_andersonii.AAC.1